MLKVFLATLTLFFSLFSSAEVIVVNEPQLAQRTEQKFSNYKLRAERKMGAGVVTGGALGFLGILMELNIEEDDGVIAGLGFGPGYNNFMLTWKRTFEGEYLAPYTQFGISHWFSDGRKNEIEGSSTIAQVLSSEERQSGNFNKDFFVGSLGIQYQQLNGDLKGISFFMQFDLLPAIQDQKLLLSGSVGSLYYF